MLWWMLLGTSAVIIVLGIVVWVRSLQPHQADSERLRRIQNFSSCFYAHRGLHQAGIPENSLQAHEQAFTHGYGVELDVRLSSDGVLVVVHDDSLRRLCGVETFVHELTAQELAQLNVLNASCGICRLEEVLECFSQAQNTHDTAHQHLIIEIKPSAEWRQVCEKTERLLRQYPVSVLVESFDPRIVRWWYVHHPQYIRALLVEHYDAQSTTVRFWPLRCFANSLMYTRMCHPDMMACRLEDLSAWAWRVQRFWYKPLYIFWTIRSQKVCNEALGYGGLVIFENFEPAQHVQSGFGVSDASTD